MEKTVRYFLLFCTSVVGVVLLATAAGLAAVGTGPGYAGWATGFEFGKDHRCFIRIYSETALAYDFHEVSLPISWLDLCVFGLLASALACLIVGGVVAKPLFLRREGKD